MKVQIVKGTDGLWYSTKLKFPVKTEVIEASEYVDKHQKSMQVDGVDSYESFWRNNNVEDFYYCNQLMGFIAKSDCINDEDYVFTNSTADIPIVTNYGIDKTPVIKTNRVFKSGAQRDTNKNKPFVHNLKGYTRLRFGYHMTKGAQKYGDNNWQLGMPEDQYKESIDRHWAQFLNGDNSEDHLSAIIFGINGIMDNERKDGVPADNWFQK